MTPQTSSNRLATCRKVVKNGARTIPINECRISSTASVCVTVRSGEKGLTQGPGAKVGDFAFLGCMGAWGVTEIIRYGFFALQVLGLRVPSWWMWLRYNTFFVLYPIGISSECILIFKALEPAAELNPLYKWFLIANLVIYVPGSYILYTHMMAQRRRVLRGKKRVD